MVKKLYILPFYLLVLFTCISCINKDIAIRPLHSQNDNLNTALKLPAAAAHLNTEAALLLQISSDNNKLLLVVLILTILFSGTIYYTTSLKHKKERLMEGYAVETRLAKKLHDEIANQIYGTMNFISTDYTMPLESKEKLIAQLDNFYKTTRDISRETNSIDTGNLYPEHLRSMLTSYTTSDINIITKGIDVIDWGSVNQTKKIATYRSLQELMVNMKKHSNASVVLIDFITRGKKIEIRYSDNGNGCTKGKMVLKNGLLNVEDRMNSISGNMIFDDNSNKGFHLILTYPQYTPYVQKNLDNRRHRQY